MDSNRTSITTVDRAPSLALLEASDAAARYRAAARSPRTLDAYRKAWEAFGAWTLAQGLRALPASPATVEAYLAHRAQEGAKPASLGVYLSAICEAHRVAGHDARALRGSAPVRTVMAGIKRTVGATQRQAAPATVEALRAMVAKLPGDLLGGRDRALLLVGFAGAFRRSELVAIEVADLSFGARGLEVVIRRSKTDQASEGRTVAIPFATDPDLCPVRALRAWLDATSIEAGPVFRSVRAGRVGRRLDGRDVARTVKRSAERAGLDSRAFSGHSLRAGLATAAALAGKSDRAIMTQGRWSGRAMVDRYVRGADRWRDNAAGGLL